MHKAHVINLEKGNYPNHEIQVTLADMYEWVNGFVTMDNVRDILGTNLGRDSSRQDQHRFKDRYVARGSPQDRQDNAHRHHQDRRVLNVTQERDRKQPEPPQEKIA